MGPVIGPEATAMYTSLCETCRWMREVVTPKGSRFLLCQLSQTNPAFAKYPPQPVIRCVGYHADSPNDKAETNE